MPVIPAALIPPCGPTVPACSPLTLIESSCGEGGGVVRVKPEWCLVRGQRSTVTSCRFHGCVVVLGGNSTEEGMVHSPWEAGEAMNKGRVGQAFLQTAHPVPGLCAVTKMATGTRLQRRGHETRQVSFPDWEAVVDSPAAP